MTDETYGPLTSAWRDLERQRSELGAIGIAGLFQQDPDRPRRFGFEATGLFLDLSRQRIDSRIFESLVDLARQTGVREGIESMFAGDTINTTENRAALHVALRRPSNQALTLDGLDVMPVVEAKVRIVRRIAMGASLGGVASLHASWMRPGVFDALVLQAGSFVDQLGGPFHRSHAFDPVIRFLKQFGADHRTLPGRIHLSCGRFDGLINETRGMARYLADNGVDVAYTDVAAGHDWHAWRDMLRHALIHTLATTG